MALMPNHPIQMLRSGYMPSQRGERVCLPFRAAKSASVSENGTELEMYFMREGFGSLFITDEFGSFGVEVFVTEEAVEDVARSFQEDPLSRACYLGHVTEEQLMMEGRIHRDQQFRVGSIMADTVRIVTNTDVDSPRGERRTAVGTVRLHGENDSSRQLIDLALNDSEQIQGSLDFVALVMPREVEGREALVIERVIYVRSFDFVPAGDFGGLFEPVGEATTLAMAACKSRLLSLKGESEHMDLEKLQREHPELVSSIQAAAKKEVEDAKGAAEKRASELEAAVKAATAERDALKREVETLKATVAASADDGDIHKQLAEMQAKIASQAEQLAMSKATSAADRAERIRTTADAVWREEATRCGLDLDNEADRGIVDDLRESLRTDTFATSEGGDFRIGSADVQRYRDAAAQKLKRVAERMGVTPNPVGDVASRGTSTTREPTNAAVMSKAVANAAAMRGAAPKTKETT